MSYTQVYKCVYGEVYSIQCMQNLSLKKYQPENSQATI